MTVDVLVIGHADVPGLLPMPACIDAVAEALCSLSRGDAVLPLRSISWLPDRRGGLGIMPGMLGDPPLVGVKVVTVFPSNEHTAYESHQGAVMLFDAANGCPVAIIDGGEITAIRTAAASGVATRLLARPDAGDLAIIGTGTQARTHLEAMRAVRPLRRVRVWSRTAASAERFAATAHTPELPIEVCGTAREAVLGADIVCTLTAAHEPVLASDWIADGAHLNAVGACIPTARELDSDLVARSRLFVDSRESATHEAGDFLIPRAEGRFDETHIVAELGQVVSGDAPARTTPDQVTLFKSLGVAVEDLAAAHLVLTNARAAGAGTRVPLGGLRA